MVGDGPDRAKAESRCRELGLSDDVVFLGKVKNPIEPLLISDLLMLPSETESFGLVALEAMAAGVPVVSSNVGGLPEVNVQNESGFLCNVGDVEGMAHGAMRILSDEALPAFKNKPNAALSSSRSKPSCRNTSRSTLRPSTTQIHEQFQNRPPHRAVVLRRPVDRHHFL